jgi:hypothetical protein
MSAAAPDAHRQSPDPDSTLPHTAWGESAEKFGRAAYRQRQIAPLRGRGCHELPCEP